MCLSAIYQSATNVSGRHRRSTRSQRDVDDATNVAATNDSRLAAMKRAGTRTSDRRDRGCAAMDQLFGGLTTPGNAVIRRMLKSVNAIGVV